MVFINMTLTDIKLKWNEIINVYQTFSLLQIYQFRK